MPARCARQGIGAIVNSCGTAFETDRFRWSAHRADMGIAFLLRLTALLCLLVAACLPAQASVTHTVKFGQGPVVMVWQNGEGAGRGETVTLGGGSAINVPPAPVGGGMLQPVTVSDGVGATRREFIEIASNAPVNLRLSKPPMDGTLTLRLVRIGNAADYSGPFLIEYDFARDQQTRVLTIGSKTAAKPGAARDQALVFELVRTGAAASVPLVIEAMQ